MQPYNSRNGPPNQYDTAYLGMGGWGAPVTPNSMGSGTFSLDVPQIPLGTYGAAGSPTNLVPTDTQWQGMMSNPAMASALNVNTGAPAAGNSWFGDMFKGAVGTKEAPGWGGLALGAAGGLANAYFGMEQLNLAKSTLDQNKRQFELNYQANRTTTNTALEDRQSARVASNAGAYQSVGDYMKKNGV